MVLVTGSQVMAQTDQAMQNLQLELNALNSMTDTIGPMVGDAKQRLAQMQAFIKEKNLTGEYSSFKAADNAPQKPSLTFMQAYNEAIKAEKLKGTVTVSTKDLGLLSREVDATTSMVKQSWANLNSKRQDVAEMTAFLNDKGMMNDYTAWGPTYQAEQKKIAKQNAAKEQAAWDAKQKKINAAYNELQKRWDYLGYSTGLDYNYPVSQGGTYGGSGDTQGISRGSTGYSGSNYYSCSYWNGYYDPYYDVHGYPRRDAAGSVDSWNRAESHHRRESTPTAASSVKG